MTSHDLRKSLLLFTATIILALVACATGPEIPRVSDPDFSQHNVATIALQPVVFLENQPDIMCDHAIPQKMSYNLNRFVQMKGYQVVRTSPDAAPPPGADALLQVTIGHYRERGFCVNREGRGMDVDATAELILLPEKKVVWSNQTRILDYSHTDVVNYVPYQMARELLATLPNRAP